MIPRKEFQFENEFVKIINPGVELQKELGEKIKNEKDTTTKIFIALQHLIIPKSEHYDFKTYSLEEFKIMFEEVELYQGLEEIVMAITLAMADIVYKNLQRTNIALSKYKNDLATLSVENQLREVVSFVDDIQKAKKKEEVAERIDRIRKERSLFPTPVPTITKEEKEELLKGIK